MFGGFFIYQLTFAFFKIFMFDSSENISNSEIFIARLGLRIRTLRKEKGMTQLELAADASMEESALQRIEKGRTNPTVKTLFKICSALNVEFVELFLFDTNNKSI